MISRAELDELYRADDEVRAEHAEWLARREAQARPFVRKSEDPAGLIFKTVENAPAPALQPDAANFSHDDETLYALNEFSEAVVERFREIDRENIRLKAQLDVVLQLLGKSDTVSDLKSADVIDLPDWRRRDVA
jgi:hypothetical protein